MSWQDYVDNQLLASACVSRAAIAGHDGGIWAKSDGFEVRINHKKKCRMLNYIVKFAFLFGPIFLPIIDEEEKKKYTIAHIVALVFVLVILLCNLIFFCFERFAKKNQLEIE